MTNQPIVQVKNLGIRFIHNRKETIAVDDISFDIQNNQVMALVGESGSGKTVTALSIPKLLDHAKLSGEIFFNQQNTFSLSKEKIRNIRRNEISVIFQEPLTSLNPLHTIEVQIKESITLHQKLSSTELHAETIKLLEDTGLKNSEIYLKRFPHQLSGGQRQRIMIAMAIACKPKLLIADEPTTALDVTTQSHILELLLQLKQKYKMSILFITHDLYVVEKVAEYCAVMQKGKIVEQGRVKDIFNNPQHQYTRELIYSTPRRQVVNTNNNLPLLKVEELSVQYQVKKNYLKDLDSFYAIRDLSFFVKKSHTLGIVGESGSGKTSLVLGLLGLEKYTGKIFFDNQALHLLTPKQMKKVRSNLQIVFQDPFSSLNPRFCIKDIILEGLYIHEKHLTTKEYQEKLIQVLDDVQLNHDISHCYPHELSGGERQRVAIARAIILKPKLIIFDEPTSALDRSIQQHIIKLLQNLQKQYHFSYIFISHDLRVIQAVSHHIIVLKRGRIVESGSHFEILKKPKNYYTKNLIKSAYRII